MSKSTLVEVTLHPQRDFNGEYYNVYFMGGMIGTITDNKLSNAFHKYGTKIVDVSSGTFGASKFKFPKNILEEIMVPYVKPKPKKKRKLKFKAPFHLEDWEERDRVNIALVDANNQTVFELWDDDVRDAIESGFLNMRDPLNSMIEMAEAAGKLKSFTAFETET